MPLALLRGRGRGPDGWAAQLAFCPTFHYRSRHARRCLLLHAYQHLLASLAVRFFRSSCGSPPFLSAARSYACLHPHCVVMDGGTTIGLPHHWFVLLLTPFTSHYPAWCTTSAAVACYRRATNASAGPPPTLRATLTLQRGTRALRCRLTWFSMFGPHINTTSLPLPPRTHTRTTLWASFYPTVANSILRTMLPSRLQHLRKVHLPLRTQLLH